MTVYLDEEEDTQPSKWMTWFDKATTNKYVQGVLAAVIIAVAVFTVEFFEDAVLSKDPEVN